MTQANITRRQMLAAATGVLALGAESCDCEPPSSTDFVNIVLHGAFLVTLRDKTILIEAPTIEGHSYGSKWGNVWSELTGHAVWPGSSVPGELAAYASAAKRAFPQLAPAKDGKAINLKRKLDWSLTLPIPNEVWPFRCLTAGAGQKLSGDNAGNPSITTLPEVLVLRFLAKDGSGLNDGRNSVRGGENLSLYAEPAFAPGNDLQHFRDCFDPAVDVKIDSALVYSRGGPYYNYSINVTETDTRHLYEILRQGQPAQPSVNRDDKPPGNLPFGL